MKFGDFFRSKRAKYGNIFKTYLLGSPTVRVIGAELIRKILQGEHVYVSTAWPKTVRYLMGEKALAMSSGHVHHVRRKFVQKAFGPSALESYVQEISQVNL